MAAFQDYMPLPPNMEPHLKEALACVLRTPGSLMRPEVVLQVSLAYQVHESAALDLAIGLEYFHTASLLFDDLPAMDDAFERRGAPCLHLQCGDAGAILTALALVNRAYFLTWRAISHAQRDPQTHIQTEALVYLERQLGVHGLLNGQSMDLHFASLPQDLATNEQTAIGKTVSLIRLTLVLPAMLGGAPPQELQLLDRIAVFWGLSYQILDDLKDVLQTSAESGKTPSRDRSLGRPNIALVLGIANAAGRLTRLIALGDRALANLVRRCPDLRFLEALRADLSTDAEQLMQGALLQTAGDAA
jgi:geranylgeranyl pyrophosphate synthase